MIPVYKDIRKELQHNMKMGAVLMVFIVPFQGFCIRYCILSIYMYSVFDIISSGLFESAVQPAIHIPLSSAEWDMDDFGWIAGRTALSNSV